MGKEHYPDWYDGPPDPHIGIKKLDDGRWQCVDCGEIGGIDLLYREGCTVERKPCGHCGCSPVCSSDCKGIGEALSDPDVYVAGFDPGTEH